MISVIPESTHIPKQVALNAISIVYAIRNNGFDPKALISFLGWGQMTVYKNNLGSRKIDLKIDLSNSTDNTVIVDGIVYRKSKQFAVGTWYILKCWWQLPDNSLRLCTYAIGDIGDHEIIVNLHEC